MTSSNCAASVGWQRVRAHGRRAYFMRPRLCLLLRMLNALVGCPVLSQDRVNDLGETASPTPASSGIPWLLAVRKMPPDRRYQRRGHSPVCVDEFGSKPRKKTLARTHFAQNLSACFHSARPFLCTTRPNRNSSFADCGRRMVAASERRRLLQADAVHEWISMPMHKPPFGPFT